MSTAMPRWPDDDEFDAHPEFWTAVLLARALFEKSERGTEPALPGGGGTFEDLGYWYESAEAAAPLTPLMRAWLCYLLQQVPDKKPRGGSLGVVRRSAQTQAEYDVARRVASRQQQWCDEQGRQRVPALVTRRMIECEIGPSSQAIDNVATILAKRKHRL